MNRKYRLPAFIFIIITSTFLPSYYISGILNITGINSFCPTNDFQHFLENCPQPFPNHAVDNEVDGSIADKCKIVEAGKAEEPGGRDEVVAAPEEERLGNTVKLL